MRRIPLIVVACIMGLSVASVTVTVVTEGDIARRGLTGVAERFRLVPGMEGSRTNADTWYVGWRASLRRGTRSV
ncbi:MAG: hypothetical protein ABR964_15210 [Tepidisphaeraceae bacterium]|jgi:hypothetical protein